MAYLEAANSSEQAKTWTAGSLKTLYAPDVYLTRMRQALLDDYYYESVARVLAWSRSPAGRKITRLESAAREPGQDAARRTYLAGLEERQPSAYRLVLLFSNDEAAHTSAGVASALRASMHGWSLGIEQLAIADEGPEIRESEAALRKYRAELRYDVADDVLRELLRR